MVRRAVTLAVWLAACGCRPATPPPCISPHPDGGSDVTTADGEVTRFVVDKLLLPQQKTDHAIDLNGDGHKDNQFGNLVMALAAGMLDAQHAEDSALRAGTGMLLLSFQSPSPA